jgi:hypothetical protein
MEPLELQGGTPEGRLGALRRPQRDTGGWLPRRRALGGGCQNRARVFFTHGGTHAAPRRRGAARNARRGASRPRVRGGTRRVSTRVELRAAHVCRLSKAAVKQREKARDQIRESIMILLTMGLNSDHFGDQPFKTQNEFQNDHVSLSNS